MPKKAKPASREPKSPDIVRWQALAAADSDGRMPVTGCHSVIDRPDRVSLVMPPITTIMKIMPQHTSSQTATARKLGALPAATAAVGGMIADGKLV